MQVKDWQTAVLLASFALRKTPKPRTPQKCPYVHLQHFSVIVVEGTMQKEEHLLIHQPDFYKQLLWPVQEPHYSQVSHTASSTQGACGPYFKKALFQRRNQNTRFPWK